MVLRDDGGAVRLARRQSEEARAAMDVETVGRLLLAAALGFVIGLEREFSGQSAGERTHALVALASAGFTHLSLTAFPGADVSRVAAGIVTGLGFLGAGTILKAGESRIHGLTTAAGIWVVGAIGMAIGAGQYTLGVAMAALAMAILLSERVFRRIGARRPGGDPPA